MDSLRVYVVKQSDIGYNGYLFGGNLLYWVDEVGYSHACKLIGSTSVVTKQMDSTFIMPIRKGDILIFKGSEIKRGNTSLQMKIEVYRTDNSQLVYQGILTFIHIDNEGRPKSIQSKL